MKVDSLSVYCSLKMATEARKDFHHPYEPYDIQQDLMIAIYNCIRDGKVGIFESPTGTVGLQSALISSYYKAKFPGTLHLMTEFIIGQV